ncbi:MAG TPA: ABC transporter substrate-binding protein [Oryzihumus sp.]|nr:ABC transporter substrate-binding protein [Oryzihumus sp.]
MTRPTSPVLRAAVGVAVASLALSACGSNTLSSGGSSSSAPAPSQTKNADLAAKLPASIKSSGTIRVGVDATYAPNEFLAADGKTVQGMDVDLFNAVAQEFGVKVQWQPAAFDSIITGVQGGKYDMGISSFSINSDRLKQVNMVSYFNAGTEWAAAKGNPKKVDPNNPCGLNVAVQKGTTQAEQDLPPKVKKCASQGKPMNVLIYTGQDQATAAVATGKADAMLADSPIVAYAVKQSGGKIEAVGSIYDSAPYGYVVPKSQTEFAQAIVDALKSLDSSGGYKKALTNWGVENGAINNFAVNPTS